MALMCKVMFCGVVWNYSAISARVTQTVPPSARNRMRDCLSSVV
jgi:hypothetical protein